MDRFDTFRRLYKEADDLSAMSREKGVKNEFREMLQKKAETIKSIADSLGDTPVVVPAVDYGVVKDHQGVCPSDHLGCGLTHSSPVLNQ